VPRHVSSCPPTPRRSRRSPERRLRASI
jgi:hypothetical protein